MGPVTGRRTAAGAALAGLVAAVLTAVGGPASGTSADPRCVTPPTVSAGATKILTIGDSLTSAAAGDYTWRYFLWKHLVTDAGADPTPSTTSFDFVGPYTLLADPVKLDRSSAQYRCPFAEENGAIPGTFLAKYLTPNAGVPGITQMMQTSNADVLLVFVGINDIVRNSRTAAQVIADSSELADEAQAVNKNVKIVFLTMPLAAGTPAAGSAAAKVKDFNSKLVAQAPGWKTATSKVVVAAAANSWAQPDLTYDGIHPNPQGEVTIATKVAAALHAIGVGPAPRPIPDYRSLVGPLDQAVLAQPVVSSGSAKVSWTLPLGSIRTRVYRKDYSVSGGAWTLRGTVSTPTSAAGPPYHGTYNDSGVKAGHVFQYRLLSAKGTNATSKTVQWAKVYSHAVTVPKGAILPSSGTPGDIKKSSFTATAIVHGVKVSWGTAGKATGYRLSWRVAGSSSVHTQVLSSKARSYTVSGLAPGRTYGFRVRGTNASGNGNLTAELKRVPKAYALKAPARPKLVTVAGHRFKATWASVRHATRYLVQVRIGTGRWKSLGFVARSPFTSKALAKGTMYAVRTRPYDGAVGGPYSAGSSVTIK